MNNLKRILNIAIRFLLLFLVLNSAYASNLSCTNENGLQIVYLNGVNTSYTYAESTAKNIENIIKTDSQVAQKIEYNKKINVGFVHNESLGLYNDMLELRNQVFYSFNKESRQNYYLNQLKEKFEKIEAFNLDLFRNAPGNYLSHVSEETRKEHAKLREALVKLTGKNYKELNKSFDKYEASYRNTFKSYDNSVRNLFELAFYDTKTSDMTSSRMSAILAGKKDPYLKDESSFNKGKLIMIAHSQGNQMLETAYNQVFHPTDETYLSNDEKINYKKYLGILNVASPSSSSTMGCLRSNGSGIINADCRNEAIKLNTDLIIFGSSYVIQPPSQYAMKPNFTVDEIKTSGILAKEISPLKPDIARGLIESYLGTTFRHGMNEVYLSDKFFAIEESSTTPSKKLKDAFIRKLASVAESLPSNCGAPLAKITGPAPKTYYPRDTLTFSAEGSFAYESMPNADEEPTYHWSAISNITGELIAGTGKKFSFPAPPVSQPFTMSLVVVNKAGYSSGKTVLIESKPLPFTADLFSYRVESLDENNIRIHTTADCDSGQIVMVLDVYDHRTAYSFPLCSFYEVGTKNKHVDMPFGVKTKVDLFYFHRNYDPKVFFDW